MHPTAARVRCVACVGAIAWLLGSPSAGAARLPHELEQTYGDWLDANYAVSTLRAGPPTRIDGRDLADWASRRTRAASQLQSRIRLAHRLPLDAAERAALVAIEHGLGNAPTAPAAAAPDVSATQCTTATDLALERVALSQALYACFEAEGNHIRIEGRTIVRTTALELLQDLDDGERRQALFTALGPLWRSINADDGPTSPYRRLLRLAAAQHAATPIDAAARTVGQTIDGVEHWLVEILEARRIANPGPPVEPWDYWHLRTRGVAALDPLVPAESIEALSARYYRDLGVDLAQLGVTHDLAVRPGKAPLAYADFVRIGRSVDGRWNPALARVSANVERGGVFVLNEIIHEDGHAAHMTAVRARPAYFDLGDDLYVEAFADVTSWGVAEAAWQRRYLGRSVDQGEALRALYANVMLDVAWGLFELRLLRAPDTDPNVLWTEITSRYLNVQPHAELSWWALRVQLVDQPGYMINYGLGAVLTADLRAHTRGAIGPFDAGNARWYPWLSRHLLRFGASLPTRELLRRFLGRPVSTDALVAELRRIGAGPGPNLTP